LWEWGVDLSVTSVQIAISAEEARFKQQNKTVQGYNVDDRIPATR